MSTLYVEMKKKQKKKIFQCTMEQFFGIRLLHIRKIHQGSSVNLNHLLSWAVCTSLMIAAESTSVGPLCEETPPRMKS